VKAGCGSINADITASSNNLNNSEGRRAKLDRETEMLPFSFCTRGFGGCNFFPDATQNIHIFTGRLFEEVLP